MHKWVSKQVSLLNRNVESFGDEFIIAKRYRIFPNVTLPIEINQVCSFHTNHFFKWDSVLPENDFFFIQS